MHVNLLPASFVRRVAMRQVLRKWGVAVAIIALLAVALVSEKYLALLSSRQSERSSAFQSKDARLLQTDIERIHAEAESLQAEIVRLQRARPEDHTLSLLGVASSSVKELAGKLQLKQLATQMAPVASSPPGAVSAAGNRPTTGAAASEAAPNDLILEGVAENAGVIAAFVDVLRGTQLFQRVDLASTSETTGASGPVRQFRVNCRF